MQAARTVGDSVGIVLLPPLGVAYWVVPVSACSIWIFSGGTPNSSEATIAIIVLVPVPMSLAPMFRLALPSEKSLTTTVEGGPPPPAIQSALAIPTPRRICPLALDSDAFFFASLHPKACAPCSMHFLRPVV